MEYSVKDKDINDFRSCKIHFSKKAENIEKIKIIMEDHNLDMGIIDKINSENKKLNVLKNDKFLIDFIIDDHSKIKNSRVKNNLKLKVLEFNDELCRIQRKLEKDLRESEEI